MATTSTKVWHAPKIQVPDPLAQRIAIETENFGRLYLISPSERQGRGDQGRFKIVQDPMIESYGRKSAAERTEKIGDRAFHCRVEPVPGNRSRARSAALPVVLGARRRRERRSDPRAQFRFDKRIRDHVLRIERGEPARQVLELSDVPRPGVATHSLHSRRIDRLQREPLGEASLKKRTHEVWDVFRALAKRRQPDRHDVEAEEQVLSKPALLNREPQIFVRSGDDANVGLDRRPSANGRILALLQNS